MTDPQNPFDQVEKKREEVRDSGYANEMQEKTINQQSEEKLEENKLNLKPDEQEDVAEKIREKKFKKEEKEEKKWWQFWK